MRALALLIPLTMLAACDKPGEADSPPVATSASVPANPAAVAPAAASARKVSEANEVYEFDYAYPAEAAAIPALKGILDADLDKQKADLAAQAGKDKKEAEKEGFPYRTYSRGEEWKVVTETPGWLSLSSTISTYSGGAHGMYWFDTILWDKQAGRQREPKDLFVSKQALTKAVQPEFCRQLDKQREQKRGEPVRQGSDDPFGKCLDPADYVVILGSSDRKAFDRIGVLVPPYEAGPYAEGAFEVTLPVTPAILAAVKPEFRSSFAVAR